MDYVISNIFSSGEFSVPSQEKHLIHIFQDICNGEYKDKVLEARESIGVKSKYDRLKKNLPSFTPCGTFNNRRLITNIKQYNGIIPIDFDNIKSESKANFLKLLLSRDSFIAGAFISPSYGLKAFVVTDILDSNDHKYGFEAVSSYIEGKYGSLVSFKVDPSGKDITRLCYISYDPTMHINTSSEIFEVNTEDIKLMDDFKPIKTEITGVRETNLNRILEFCIKGVNASKTGRYAKGNRNNWVYSLARLTNQYGVPYEFAFNYIGQRYSSLGYEEMKTTLSSAYKNKHEFGSKSLATKKNKGQNSLL